MLIEVLTDMNAGQVAHFLIACESYLCKDETEWNLVWLLTSASAIKSIITIGIYISSQVVSLEGT